MWKKSPERDWLIITFLGLFAFGVYVYQQLDTDRRSVVEVFTVEVSDPQQDLSKNVQQAQNPKAVSVREIPLIPENDLGLLQAAFRFSKEKQPGIQMSQLKIRRTDGNVFAIEGPNFRGTILKTPATDWILAEFEETVPLGNGVYQLWSSGADVGVFASPEDCRRNKLAISRNDTKQIIADSVARRCDGVPHGTRCKVIAREGEFAKIVILNGDLKGQTWYTEVHHVR